MISKNLGVHLGAFGVSALVAFQVMVAGEQPEVQADALVWQAPVEQLERVEYVKADSTLVMEAKRDDAGRYYVATFEHEPPREPAPTPADAGAEPPAEEGAETPRETLRFIGVENANQLGEQLATLSAVRDLGMVPPERLEDYGLAGAELPRLSVTLNGASRQLKVGGKAPGDGDVYVQSESDGRVYAIPGRVMRELDAAQTRLMERSLHAFEPEEAGRARIEIGEQTAEVVQLAEANGWAQANTPEAKDETATNWMRKLRRLRVTRYLEHPPQPPEVVFRIEYGSPTGEPLGFVELARLPGEADAEADYVARSETTRWWGVVLTSNAEGLAQDASSLIR